jgi:hypothetical protein
MDGHEEFRELCVISLSGELTREETARLDEHLRTCASCEKAFHQYRERSRNKLTVSGHQSGYVVPPARWREFGMLYAAGILLFLALTTASYRLGAQHGIRNTALSVTSNNSSDQDRPDYEHDRLVGELAARDKTISGLEKEIASKGSGVREDRARLPAGASTGGTGLLSENERSMGGAGSISPEMRIAELERQLAEAQRTGSEEAALVTVLEATADELKEQLRDHDETLGRQRTSLADTDRLLQDRDKTITDQQDLLAHDRDIRELMGSRNLYIAEVDDVAKTGQTSKPFGRVFYTKGRSLIFYAYDLDPQPSVKTASSFQVWGREEANQRKAVSLGVFYEDSVANKRWVLKSQDAKSLEQIDAVFVTIEPNGGSQRPSGKPLLCASLKTAPNHP